MKPKSPLLIDKNFLQGSKSSEIQRLMETRRLLMADTLFTSCSAQPSQVDLAVLPSYPRSRTLWTWSIM